MAILAQARRLPRRQPVHDLGLQVRALRGGRARCASAPGRAARSRWRPRPGCADRRPPLGPARATPRRATLLARAAGRHRDELTPHQREVLVALALNEVPIDVLADRLSTTRGALYKTLHDARRKLRARLAGARPRPRRTRREDGRMTPTPTGRRRAPAGPALGPAGPESAASSASRSSTATSSSSSPARDADAAVPGMRAHLEGCPACAEDRDSLRALPPRGARARPGPP